MTAIDLITPGTTQHVFSVHYPTVEADGRILCRACGEPGFCRTFRRQAVAQLGTADRILAHIQVLYVRAMSHPGLRRAVPGEVHETFFGWISGAAEAQRRLDAARERAAVAVSTGAQRAVQSVTRWYQNHVLSALTPRGLHRADRPPMGQPAEGRR
jgi:hypothetical protein